MPLRVRGVDELKARIDEMKKRARDMTPVLNVFRSELDAMIDRAWHARRSPGGDNWAPLQGPSSSDGDLRRNGQIIVTKRSLRILYTLPYAIWQFFGTPSLQPRNPLPVEKRGGVIAWMDRGEARAWRESMIARTRAYLEAAP